MWASKPDRPVLLDGAIGTELIARGLRVREECPEGWNLERPDDVRDVHAAYARAGSKVVQTNSFGATRPRLRRFGRETQVRELNLRAARLAREGAPGCMILGSLGPSGENLPLAGRLELDWLEDAFAEAAAALAEGGVEAIHVETMFHPAELIAAVRGARAGAPALKVAASMTLIVGAAGTTTPAGVPLERMVEAARAAEPDAVGINCSLDAERMLGPLEQLRRLSPLIPLWAKPQAKLSEKCASGRSSETPDAFARRAVRLVEDGLAAIGGCCGVGPAGIAELGRRLAGAEPARAGARP